MLLIFLFPPFSFLVCSCFLSSCFCISSFIFLLLKNNHKHTHSSKLTTQEIRREATLWNVADGLYTDGQARSRASLPTLWRALVTQLSKTQDAFSDGDSSVPTLLHKGSLESRGVRLSLLEKHGDPSRGCSHLPAAAQLWAAGSHGGLTAGNLAGEGPFPPFSLLLPAQPSRGGRGSEGVSVGGAKQMSTKKEGRAARCQEAEASAEATITVQGESSHAHKAGTACMWYVQLLPRSKCYYW